MSGRAVSPMESYRLQSGGLNIAIMRPVAVVCPVAIMRPVDHAPRCDRSSVRRAGVVLKQTVTAAIGG